MSLIVRYITMRASGPSCRLVSITAALVLGLWLGCSTASGFSSGDSPALSDVPHPRFTIFHEVWSREPIPLLSPADVLYEVILFSPTWADHNESAATLQARPLLAAVTYAHSDVLQFSLRQFLLPAAPLDLTTLLSLSLEMASDSQILRRFTVAQMDGTVWRNSADQQALHYALYAGALTDESPDQLLVGARLRYTFKHGEVTVGFDALYSPYTRGTDSLTPFVTARAARLPSSESQIVELLLRLNQDRRVLQDHHSQGRAAGDASPLGVFIKPVLHLTPQWAVHYRFDHTSFGQGLPQLTEHVFGVRFFPMDKIVLRAEFLKSLSSQAAIDTEGFRLSGTIRF